MMGDVDRINVYKLDSYKSSFKVELENFTNSSFSELKLSHVGFESSEETRQMYRNLYDMYTNMQTSYNNIDNWLNEYLHNVKGIIDKLSEQSSSNHITESTIISAINSLPVLNEYKETKIGNINFSSTSTNVSAETTSISTINEENDSNSTDASTNFISQTGEVIEKLTASTAALGVTSIEGIGNFFEGMVKTGAVISTAEQTPIALVKDLFNYATGADKVDGYISETDKLWSSTMDFMSKKYVKGFFDNIYDNTSFGSYLKSGYDFDTIRGIGNGIGEITGAVVTAVFTCGISGIASSGTLFTIAGAKVSGSAVVSGAMYGASTMGNKSGEAYASGSSISDSLAYGFLNGALSGAELTVGNIVNGVSFNLGKSAITKFAVNSGFQVAADAVTGWIRGVATPGISTFINPSDETKEKVLAIVNANGENKTYDQLSFSEKYNALFDLNGGWKELLTQTVTGAFMSTLTQFSGVLTSKVSKMKVSLFSKLSDKIVDKYKLFCNDYIDNIKDYQADGISFENFMSNKGFNLKSFDTKNDVAKYFSDAKLYLFDKLFNAENNLSTLTDDEQILLSKLKQKYGDTQVGNISLNNLYNDVVPFLTGNEIEEVKSLTAQSGQYTNTQLKALFNYTNCGGHEINSWLNDTTVGNSTKSLRSSYSNLDDLQNAISGFVNGKNRKNVVFNSSEGKIVDELDSVIAKSSYDNSIVSWRGVKGLYDKSKKLDISLLEPGDSFTTKSYQSSSILLENSYAVTHSNEYDTLLKIITPQKSGTSAFIESQSGCKNYIQMEVLTKRNANMVVLSKPYVTMINGVYKNVVEVLAK